MTIALSDHLLRLCKGNWVHKDPAGKILGTISHEAFRPDPDDADGLSVNHLEYFPGAYVDRVNASRAAISTVFSNLRKAHRLAVLKAKTLKDTAKPLGYDLTFVPDPIDEDLKKNPAHALVRGLPADDDGLFLALAGTLIALEAVVV